MGDNLNVSFKIKWTWPCNLWNAVSKENIIQNISQIYIDYEMREVWGGKKNENWSKINQNIDVLLSSTESKYSFFKYLNLPMLSSNINKV